MAAPYQSNQPPAVPQKPAGPDLVTVRVTRPGVCPGADSNGRHFYREAGDVIRIERKRFSDEWMVMAEPGQKDPPELPPEPPPTTLPTRPRPVTIAG